MSTEKEKLVGFTIALMEELGPAEFLDYVDREAWLKSPIAGVRQAANDMLEATGDIAGDELNRLNTVLSDKGLPTLSNMRDKSFKKVIQLLSRNKLKSEDEWRLLRAFTETSLLGKAETEQAQMLMDHYEFKRT